MAAPDEIVLRQRFCVGVSCGAMFFLCSRCDRGQRYCSIACREQSRREQHRRANCRHQQSPEGRLDHRDRQRRYRRRRSKLRGYANVGLLCVDEVGYLSFDDKAADLLYEVINRRYERKPVILTSNRPFKEWNEVFPNATCIVTLLDRLLHHADVTVIEGESYRVRESEQETAARRRRQ